MVPKLNEVFWFTHNGYVKAYVDGCCFRNGSPNASAGIGVWFGPNNPHNLSARCNYKQTNQNAEIEAASEAMRIVKEQGYSKILILTDSRFVISCATEWMYKWRDNGWRNAKGLRVANYEALQKLDNAMNDMQAIRWVHIDAHSGNVGNEEADRLAKAGASYN